MDPARLDWVDDLVSEPAADVVGKVDHPADAVDPFAVSEVEARRKKVSGT